jgi:hypothetical protein
MTARVRNRSRVRSLVDRVANPRLRSDCIDLTGQRFGRLTVLRPGPSRLYPSGQTARTWWVACDCGTRYTAQGRHLRKGLVRRCRPCGLAATAAANRARSTALPSGRTIVEVSTATGVALNTVTQRWIRGWAEKDLGLPVVGKFGRRQRAQGAA